MNGVLKRRAVLGGMAVALWGGVALQPVWAQALEAPEALIQRLATDLMDTVKTDPALRGGDANRLMALVDSKLMPHVNFRRMTASAVGKFWRQATAEQQLKLQAEFKVLLVRTYAGALAQLKDQALVVKPMRGGATDNEVVVKSELRAPGKEAIQLEYRLEKTEAGWKIYDLNVLGIWLIDNYRNQFGEEIKANGLDGLIAALVQRNRTNEGKSGANKG